MRQGGDPRLPLELALVKVTRPGGDLSRESLAFRLEQLEQRLTGGPAAPASAPATAAVERTPERATPVAPQPAADAPPTAEPPPLELEQLQEAWRRTSCRQSSRARSRSASTLGEAHPAALELETLTLEFPPTAAFHLRLAEEPKNVPCSARRSTR